MEKVKLNCVVILFATMFLSSCSVMRQYEEDANRKKVILANQSKVEVGLSKADVIKIMGTPCNIQFEDKNQALQYCYTSSVDGTMYSNHYVVIWLYDGVVTSMTTYDDVTRGMCTESFRSINWENSPGYLMHRR